MDLDGYTTEHMYNSYTLCSKHFEDSQFMNSAKKNSLIHTAVPTIFDVPNPPPSVTPKRPLPKCTCATPPPKPSTAMTQPCSPTEEANNDEGKVIKVLTMKIIARHILFFQSQRKGRRPMCQILQERLN